MDNDTRNKIKMGVTMQAAILSLLNVLHMFDALLIWNPNTKELMSGADITSITSNGTAIQINIKEVK